MNSYDIRKNYLEFFKSKGHTIVPSDSLVPVGDPTVLFTGAGMNQFKDKFLGKNLTYTRATSCQKCLRTGDLDRVGKTRGHHTFFEMLGNFSFGDYFKEDAIKWAWEYVTDVLKLSKDDLWVTVYADDRESFDIWNKLIGLSDTKIQKKGMDENYWPQNAPLEGPNGPCGPCSEIYFNDLEIWNLVFTQFNRLDVNVLEPLKNKNIDTGMGLERITQVMEKALNNFETDLFVDLTKKIEAASNAKPQDYISHVNAIADHVRAVTFSINDGIFPSNESRGYVIRKLIRRSIVHLYYLGIKDAYLYKLVDAVTRIMKPAYPELEKTRDVAAQTIKKEEDQFSIIYSEKVPMVRTAFNDMAKRSSLEPSLINRELIDRAFDFYDTHGVPFDILEECANESGLKIIESDFDKRLEIQREKSRTGGKTHGEIFSETIEDKIAGLGFKTEFVGYKTFSQDAKVLAVIDLSTGKEFVKGKKNQEVGIILDRTPFYGESGGQVGDIGTFELIGKKIKVTDAKKFGNTIIHITKHDPELFKGTRVIASIDKKRRENIMKNHTATHLLQFTLREVLGDHIRQAGSVVDDKHLRFDFSHQNKIEEIELRKIALKINEKILTGDKVAIKDNVRIEDAKKDGAMAIFGEKYSDLVRVISIGNYSKELCGGTHLDNIKDIGYFKIVSESSIAAGVRRIEAVTGKSSKEYIIDFFKSTLNGLKEKIKEVNALEEKLGVKKTDMLIVNKYNNVAIEKYGYKDLDRLEIAIDELKNSFNEALDILKGLEKKDQSLKLSNAKSSIDDYVKNSRSILNSKVVIERIDNTDVNILRVISDEIKCKLNSSSAILLGGKNNEKPVYIMSITDDLVKKGLDAVSIIKSVSSIVDGSGGGRPNFAQAGGKSADKLDESLKSALGIIEKELSK